ncbi:MAG: hypothetical protein M9883_08595 [Methylobacteriaceae bacterium]|nr:hypothetical protein [Methylobacteriaceae bacterium]MCO5086898.1 hypothetical protein [Methylobacteriaceae bacterium]
MTTPDDTDYAHRRLVNLVAAIALLILAIILVVAMNLLDNQRRLQRCLDSGRRDCLAVPTPPVAQGVQR